MSSVPDPPKAPTLSDEDALAQQKNNLRRASRLRDDTLFAGRNRRQASTTERKSLLGSYATPKQ